MKSLTKITILLGLSLAASQSVPELETAANPPLPPVWPSNFTASWNEETTWTGVKKYTGGSTTYKWNNGVNPQMIWARFDGWADIYCNTSLPQPYDTQCQHIVTGGIRYLYYPILKKCCQCCNNAQGCGVPAPTFMSNAEYLGYKLYLGRYVYSWEVGSYVYIETTSANPLNRAWAAQTSTVDNYPNVWGWKKNAGNISLPGICANSQECGGACLQRRQGQNYPPIYN